MSPTIPQSVLSEKFHYFPFLDSGPQNVQFKDYNELFNIGQPIYFIEKHENYWDLFAYASTYNNSGAISFFSNHVSELEKFKLYFMEEANTLIKNSDNHKIKVPVDMFRNISSPFQGCSHLDNQTFCIVPPPKYYVIYLKGRFIKITRREYDTLLALREYYNAKAMAISMGTTAGTVNDYLYRIKTKLGVNRKFELIKVAADIEIFQS